MFDMFGMLTRLEFNSSDQSVTFEAGTEAIDSLQTLLKREVKSKANHFKSIF